MEIRDVIIRSKMLVPVLPRNFLGRNRLLDALSNIEEPLVMIAASMGYGKTVVMSHYATEYTCGWYHLDETDNDIMAFSRYFARAVTHVMPHFDIDFAPYVVSSVNEALARNLALDCADALRNQAETRVQLVLDDFHTITNPLVYRFLIELVEHCEEHIQLFLCTKSALPPDFARLVVSQKTAHIGSEALAFTQGEIAGLMAQLGTRQSSELLAEALYQRMEGWPAGVMFLLLHLRASSADWEEELDKLAATSFMRDYFMHELFRKLSFELQQFLTATAVLQYLQPELCNLLTGKNDATTQLAYLEQENLFVIRVTGSHRFYRYHGLFRDFLLTLSTPEAQRELAEQAANYYMVTPDRRWAVEYALLSGNHQLLRQSVEMVGADLLEQGDNETLRHCLELLKQRRVPRSPEISILTGWYNQRTGRWQKAYDLANRVLEDYSQQSQEPFYLEATCLLAALTRAHISVEQSWAQLQPVMEDIRRQQGIRSDIYKRGIALYVYNLVDLKREQEALTLLAEEQRREARHAHSDHEVFLQDLQVTCYMHLGEYRKAEAVCSEVADNSSAIAQYQGLFLPRDGLAEQALCRQTSELERLPQKYTLEGMDRALLRYDLLINLGVMEGLNVEKERRLSKELWETVDLSNPQVGSPRELTVILKDSFAEGAIFDEVGLFETKNRSFPSLWAGACWIWIRRKVLAGEVETALRLCQKVLYQAVMGEHHRNNIFWCFVAMEQALLLGRADVEKARQSLEPYLPYIKSQNSSLFTMTKEEQQMLEQLLGMKPTEGHSDASAGQAQKAQTLTVHCFGPLRVLCPDGSELAWRTKKTKELFAYLYHRRGEPANKDQLMDMLWPQAMPSNATSLLHTSLYNIRKSLAKFPELSKLIAHGKLGYAMEMTLVTCHRGVLDGFAQQTVLELPQDMEPGELYPGPYLEDVEGLWCADVRAHYSGLMLSGYRRLAEEAMGGGDFRRALGFLRTAATQEPYDEDLVGLLIRCYTALGEMKNAMAQYASLKELLAKELGVEPGEEVTRTYRECLLKRLESRRSK